MPCSLYVCWRPCYVTVSCAIFVAVAACFSSLLIFCLGIRFFGVEVMFTYNLIGGFCLLIYTPLLFSLLSVALNISVAVNNNMFGICYIIIIAVPVFAAV